jgi:hypothetical protein
MNGDDFPLDEFFATVQANIDEYGVHITAVFPTEDDPGAPFAYTTGLTPHGHPELAIYGLPHEIAHSLLNTLSFSVIRDGARYAHGDTIHRLVNGFPVRMVSIIDTTEDITVSNTMYAKDVPIDALQVVFPDKHGLWPWQDGSRVANVPLHGPIPDDGEGTEITLPDTDAT